MNQNLKPSEAMKALLQIIENTNEDIRYEMKNSGTGRSSNQRVIDYLKITNKHGNPLKWSTVKNYKRMSDVGDETWEQIEKYAPGQITRWNSVNNTGYGAREELGKDLVTDTQNRIREILLILTENKEGRYRTLGDEPITDKEIKFQLGLDKVENGTQKWNHLIRKRETRTDKLPAVRLTLLSNLEFKIYGNPNEIYRINLDWLFGRTNSVKDDERFKRIIRVSEKK